MASKKLKEAGLRVIDEEEEEMERNINNISDSKEGVEDRNDSFVEVNVLNDYGNFVVDGSDPKSDPNVATHTINGFSATDTTNRISTRKLYPMFFKPAIQAVVRPIETRSRASEAQMP